MLRTHLSEKNTRLVIGQLKKIPHQWESLTYKEMERRQNQYRQAARTIVDQVVYSRPESSRYPRSYNTALSVFAKAVRDEDGIGMDVGLDPMKATNAFQYLYYGGVRPRGLLSYHELTGGGGFRFYPSYLRRGTFFRQRQAPRDFMMGWSGYLKPIFRKHVTQALRRR